MNRKSTTTVGILSDSHGLLRPEVEAALAGCDHILHAGDVGTHEVLEKLGQIAPVTAVRGNMDYGSWSNALPVYDMLDIGGVFFYLLHDLNHLGLDPAAAGIHVVVSGHTHRSHLYEKGGSIYLNPGSAGHRRGSAPVSVAMVEIHGGQALPHIIEIDC
ncbi:MAG: YfcE family phosphodiesterase [Deltaproteobacteria bacterium]|nr:MAG: YfcE family phosphodiesterase [Deltaproteobacteria bacterium]